MERYTMFTGRINMVKISTLPKAIYRFSANPSENISGIHVSRIILKFVWKHKIPQVAYTVFRKKNKAGGIFPPDARLH